MAAQGVKRKWTWERVARLRRIRRVQSFATVGVVVMAPVLALATYLILGPFDQGTSSGALRIILLTDFIYILAVAAMVTAGSR